MSDEPVDFKVGDYVFLRYAERPVLVEAIEQTGLLRVRTAATPNPRSFYARPDAVVAVVASAMAEQPEDEDEDEDKVREALEEAHRAIQRVIALLGRVG